MMRSLFAGVSGLKNHQTRMDVIGNNIANVNTIGFKKSRVTFQDMLSQTVRGASSPQGNRGGTNPMQVGLGMTMATIDVIHTPGSPQPTGKNTDLCIEGDGFFMVGEGSNIYYTRAGNFDFDYEKNVINSSNGMIVKGYLADVNGVINPNGNIVDIDLSSYTSSLPKATTKAEFYKNLESNTTANPTSSATINHTQFTETVFETGGPIWGNVVWVPADPGATINYATGTITIPSGAGSDTYTPTFNVPSYQTPITVYDSQGDTHQLMVQYRKTADNTWDVQTIFDQGAPLASGSGTLTFNNDGTFDASTVTNASVVIPGVDNMNITLDFTKLTQYAGETTVSPFAQDGYAAGDLNGISVDTSGTVTGSFSNGQTRKLAQIALATFANPAGLLKMGNNLYQVSNNSGEPDVGIPNTSGRGTIKPETLEMSNVDLSQEFVDMIITQRGFQANSRVITTSDQILEELVNLRR